MIVTQLLVERRKISAQVLIIFWVDYFQIDYDFLNIADFTKYAKNISSLSFSQRTSYRKIPYGGLRMAWFLWIWWPRTFWKLERKISTRTPFYRRVLQKRWKRKIIYGVWKGFPWRKSKFYFCLQKIRPIKKHR